MLYNKKSPGLIPGKERPVLNLSHISGKDTVGEGIVIEDIDVFVQKNIVVEEGITIRNGSLTVSGAILVKDGNIELDNANLTSDRNIDVNGVIIGIDGRDDLDTCNVKSRFGTITAEYGINAGNITANGDIYCGNAALVGKDIITGSSGNITAGRVIGEKISAMKIHAKEEIRGKEIYAADEVVSYSGDITADSRLFGGTAVVANNIYLTNSEKVPDACIETNDLYASGKIEAHGGIHTGKVTAASLKCAEESLFTCVRNHVSGSVEFFDWEEAELGGKEAEIG